MDITIKNYRCFPDESPVRISLKKGFTAFLGVNNAGKSSLLRFFYEFRHLFGQLSDPNVVLSAMKGAVQTFNPQDSVTDIAELFHNGNQRDLEIEVAVPNSESQTPQNFAVIVPRASNQWRLRWPLPGMNLKTERLSFKGRVCEYDGAPAADFSHLFSACKDLFGSLYIGPFRNAINVGGGNSYFDIPIGQTFIEQWRTLKTGRILRDREATFRLTEDIKHLFDYNQLEINASDDNKTLRLFVNGRSHNLYEMGSGLTQFILVLATASVRSPAYILIDEPELNLHPTLQRDFLTTLASYSREGVIFGTHSIGLARSIASTVYSVRMQTHGVSAVAPFDKTPRLSELLGELSFSGYKELGFDKILLVEGPKDVTAIQQLLRVLQKDHSIVLLSLGGSSMINAAAEPQLQEIKRICENVYALIDSERLQPNAALAPDRLGFSEACTRAGINCCILERRALENYLSDTAVKNVKGDKRRALTPFEKLSDLAVGWSKEENWRIAQAMDKKDWAETDLGRFLQSL